MYPSNGLNIFLLKNIPVGWFIQRREYLETYHQELSILKNKLGRYASTQNIAAILGGASALHHLDCQIAAMEESLESNLPREYEDYDLGNEFDLERIREISTVIRSELETIAGKVSWERPADLHVSQAIINLGLLLKLIQNTLAWLEQGIDS